MKLNYNTVLKLLYFILIAMTVVLLSSCSNCGSVNSNSDVIEYIFDEKEKNNISLPDPEEITGLRFYSSWDYENEVPLQYIYFTTLSSTDIIESNWLGTYYVQEPYECINITGHEQIDFAKLAECFPRLSALGIEGMEFHSFAGVEKFEQLQIINIELPSNIRDISDLAKVKSLQYITLHHGKLRDISSINNMPELTYLSIYSCRVSRLGSLEGLPELTCISLENNCISNADVISNCSTLKEIDLRDNSLTDIEFVAKLPHLQKLNISNNRIRDISCLLTLNELVYVDCRNNPIDSLQPIANVEYILNP